MAYRSSAPLGQRWYQRRLSGWAYLAQLPHRKLLNLYLAIFCLFATFGFFTDLSMGGAAPVWGMLIAACFTGGYAVLYPYVLIHRAVGFLYLIAFLNFFTGPIVATWLGQMAHTHPAHFATWDGGFIFAGRAIFVCVVGSYVFFIGFIRQQAGDALRIQNELELAHGIQRTLVPPLDVEIGGYELHGISLPSDKVGGDLVDIVTVETGTVAYVADVAGHGLSAGILMGMIKTAARTILLEPFHDPAVLLNVFCERLNRVLPGVKEAHMYATLAVLHLGPDGCVHYALAGHPAILRHSAADNAVSQLWFEQFPVGLLPVGAFATQETWLTPGDTLMISTDGILEACNGADEEFGTDRLAEIMRSAVKGSPLKTLSEEITTSVQAFGKQADDQTLLLVRCKRLESGALEAAVA